VDINSALYDFLDAIAEDPRIAPNHISLFMSVLFFYRQQEFKSPISVYSKELMKHAKISGVATYHKCIQELHNYGFIHYVPSYNPDLGSLIYIRKFINNENLYRTRN
jgi:hypothetical protein